MSLESIQFLAGLFQLHDRYETLSDHDVTIGPKWEQLRDDVAAGRPSAADIQTVRQMFRGVLRGERDASNMDPLIWGVARWMGAADHAVERRVPVRERSTEDGHLSATFSQMGIDPLRLSLLLLVSGWTSDMSPLQNSLERYLQLSPDLRSHFTSQQNVLDEIVGTILSLQLPDITPNFRDSLREIFSPEIKRYLTEMYIDLRTLLFEHGDHWVLLYNDIQDRLWESSSPVHVYWADINMTSINERDPNGNYGDDFLAVVGAWLRSRRNLQGVVRNIQRTSFQFIADSVGAVASTMRDFSSDVSHGMTSNPNADPSIVDDFIPEAVVSERVISRENLYDYAIQSLDDLDAFAPVIGFNEMFDVNELKKQGLEKAKELLHLVSPDFRGVRATGDPILIDTLNALIIKAIYEMNGRLAAQNKFFEKTDMPSVSVDHSEQGGRPHPFKVFREDDLPPSGQAELYNRWKGFEARKAGFVNPGQYFPSRNPALHDKPEVAPTFNRGIEHIALLHIGNGDNGAQLHPRVAEFLRLAPRLGRLKGEMSHRREGSPGGANDRFLDRLWDLANLPDSANPSDIRAALWAWQQEATSLSEVYHQVYALAVTDLRHAWTPKQHATFTVPRYRDMVQMHSDFVVQEMALQGSDAVAALEYDSWNAYQAAYPSTRVDDPHFNRVRDAFFVEADALGLPPPIIRPAAGDHVSVAFVDPNMRLPALSQAHVARLFAPDSFHDLHKVEMQEILFRPSNGFGRFSSLESLAEGLRKSLHLNAEVRVKLSNSTAESPTVLSVTLPTHDANNVEVDLNRVTLWLRMRGKVDLWSKVSPPVVKNIERLPMWFLERGDSQKTKKWYFGHTPPKGYKSYTKTATISLAVDTFPPITDVAGLLDFTAAELRANKALGAVKESAWPQKGGLVRVVAPHSQHELESNGFRGLVDPPLMKWIDQHPDARSRLRVIMSEHSDRSKVVGFLREARHAAGLHAHAETLSQAGMMAVAGETAAMDVTILSEV